MLKGLDSNAAKIKVIREATLWYNSSELVLPVVPYGERSALRSSAVTTAGPPVVVLDLFCCLLACWTDIPKAALPWEVNGKIAPVGIIEEPRVTLAAAVLECDSNRELLGGDRCVKLPVLCTDALVSKSGLNLNR